MLIVKNFYNTHNIYALYSTMYVSSGALYDTARPSVITAGK